MANIFPRWTNYVPLKVALGVIAMVLLIVVAVTVYATPKSTRVGYQPTQPIPYDHELHVTQLGLDCRYCHSFVEHSSQANIPSANTCWNCHQYVKKDSPKLTPLRRAMDSSYDGYDGKPIEWVRVHEAPDYVYFDHSAHVNRGVSCKSCHGEVNRMKVVYHAESQSMGWCLKCHRAPEKHLRPLEEVFNLDYNAKDYLADHPLKDADGKAIQTQEELGLYLKKQWYVKPKADCSSCHR